MFQAANTAFERPASASLWRGAADAAAGAGGHAVMEAWGWVIVLLALIAAAIMTARWMFAVVMVRGTSMEPELAEGDQLLARRCGVRRLRRGQLVVFSEPGLPHFQRPAWRTGARRGLWVIKRVAAIPGDPVPQAIRAAAGGAAVVPRGAIVVLGNAPESRDSRQWGFITSRHILGLAYERAPAENRPGRTRTSSR